MIKILLILLVSSTYVLCTSPELGFKTTNGEPLELLEVKTKAFVEGPYAEIQYTQTYKNSQNHTIEAEFHFPQRDGSTFHKFEAIFKKQTLVGEIMKKETAKTILESNTEKGNTVAYFERSQDAPDFMNIKVGNIPPNETVEIVFSVIQPLETIINKFYELKLPAVFAEKYSSWNVQVEIKSKTPFAILSNPTHSLKPELSEQLSKTYKAVWNATIIPDKDFVVYFGPEKIEKPHTILATSPQDPNNHVLLVNFVPDLATIDTKVAQDLLETSSDGVSSLKRMAFEYDTEHAQVEFIFLIDRSNSMQGARIENLRKALAKFLNTIPKNSYFNIISFGSTDQLYSPQSVQNSPQALEEVLQWVNTIQADMGGTEILEDLLSNWDGRRQSTDLPQIVMIFTGGDVLNPDLTIYHISENTNRTRFCSVGIGAGASEYLVRNMAIAGKCRSEFVQDNEDIGEKALHMVQAAISQYVTDINFMINCFNDQNKRVFSEKAELGLLLKDQSFNNWIYLENLENLRNLNSCQATLTYYNNFKGEIIREEIDIQRSEIGETANFWHKVAYDAKIRENEQIINRARGNSCHGWEFQAQDFSTRYQVLSEYTSFLAILQENNPDGTAYSLKISHMKSAGYTVYQPKLKKIHLFDAYDDGTFAGSILDLDCFFPVVPEIIHINSDDFDSDYSDSYDSIDTEVDVNANQFKEEDQEINRDPFIYGENYLMRENEEDSNENEGHVNGIVHKAGQDCENVEKDSKMECSGEPCKALFSQDKFPFLI